jgi:AraC-like DNA-binding protein
MPKAAFRIHLPAQQLGIGGRANLPRGGGHARLVLAYTGLTVFRSTRWHHAGCPWWVLDYIHHGRQRQRVGRGRTFTRLSNVAALYAPRTAYHEYQEHGDRLNESYIVFALDGQIARSFRALTRKGRYCHIHDPDQRIGDRLRRLGELLFHRKPYFQWLAQGAFFELLGLVLQSAPSGAAQRTLRVPHEGEAPSLPERIERFVRAHLDRPIRVRQLAEHVRMSVSAFAHAYPRLAGEPPYRTILRLKMEAAKGALLHDRLSVKETASRLGFSSEFHFSRAFKDMEGISPSLYRKNLTKERRRA